MTPSRLTRSTHWSAIRFAVGGFLLVIAATAAAQQRGTSASPLHLRVLATHDLHGALSATTFEWSNGRLVGGAAALASVMKTLESACACPTIRVDGGDQMQGTLESNLVFGASAVAAFNQLGLDAAAVGNHELDWGLDTLVARQKEARYGWLAANVFRKDTGERPAWAVPFEMLQRDGLTIGVIGYATVTTPRALRPDVTEPYEFRSGYAAIRDAIDAVWQKNPDFVVLVAHAGGDCSAAGCTGEMVELASELPAGSVHLIVGGHDHDPGEGVVNAIPIVRAGSSGRAVAIIDLYRLENGTRAFRMARQMVYPDAVAEDAAMVKLLAPYRAAAEAKGNERVTTLADTLSSSATGDRRLGYLIAESMRLVARADFGLHNPGGVRADLQRGAISYADLYRVMPFGNTVETLTITGRQLRQLVAQAGRLYYYANLHVEYAPGDAQGRPAALSFADKQAVQDDQSYTLATDDFLADGGDGLLMLQRLPRKPTGVGTLDALIERLRQLPAPVVLPVESR